MAQAEAKEALRRKKEKKERKDSIEDRCCIKTALDIIQSKQRAEASNNVETTKIEKEGCQRRNELRQIEDSNDKNCT